MAKRYIPRPPRALGHRGQLFTVFGLLWIAIGVGLLIEGDPPSRLQTPLVIIPLDVRAALWIATGAWAILIAWRPITRVKDASGWLALYAMPAMRAVAYAVAWVDSWTPWGAEGHGGGWLSALVYTVIVWAVYTGARWPEDPRIAERTAWEVGLWQEQRLARRAARKEG